MKLIFAILAGCLSVTAIAQEIPLTVSGKVTDSSDGKPIPYASVHLSGTMVGVSTDGNGYYIITIPEDGILVFSSISYKTKEIAVEGRKELNDLMPDSMVLEAMKSVIKVRPENRYLAYDTVKIPFRKTTGNAKKILATLEKYVTRLASIVHAEYDKDTISDGYKDLLDSKIDRIR
jgi:hypothetical protein